MGVNEKVVKCAISWKRLIVERSEWKFGTHGSASCIYVRYFSCISLWFQFGVIRCTFQKFSSDFNQTLWKVWLSGEMQAIALLAICQIKKIYITLKYFVTYDHMRLEISKRYCPHGFHLLNMGNTGITFLGNQPKFNKNYGTLNS